MPDPNQEHTAIVFSDGLVLLDRVYPMDADDVDWDQVVSVQKLDLEGWKI